MKKFLMMSAIAFAALLSGSFVFAAGGGGGGGGGSSASNCTTDTWTCDDWSTCTIGGTQTRSCRLTNDCAFASTASPDTTQSCTPACTADTWTCSDWGTCNSAGKQKRTCSLSQDCPLTNDASPIIEQSCQPSCTKDTYSCSDWSVCSLDKTQSRSCALTFDCSVAETAAPSASQSCTPDCTADTWSCSDWGACNSQGTESRTCKLSNDCSLTNDAKPAEAQECSHLQCGSKSTTRDRVLCRLNLAPAGLARESQIEYLPEVCRTREGDERDECIKYYKNFKGCWVKTGEERFDCAREQLELKDEIPAMRAACEAKGGDQAADCSKELREHVYWLILFRMYNLEQRAEDMATSKGIDLSLVADLDVAVIDAKVAFLNADSHEARRAVILGLRDTWTAFMKKINE